jgi:aspartokinase/homoserine dehydrogenase 1
MDSGASFQSAVEQAVQRGFAEPDARLDLSGQDVARKILILARTCGAELEMDQVNVQGFMKEGAMDASFTDFMQDLEAWAGPVRELHAQAKAEGKRLRYVARWDAGGQCECSLEMLAPDHPFYGLEGTDNAVAIFSLRYSDRPFVIQGAGAGAAVTASGVLSDLHAIGQSK